MTDIKKYNVQTYVEELIKKGLSSKNNEEKALSDKQIRVNIWWSTKQIPSGY